MQIELDKVLGIFHLASCKRSRYGSFLYMPIATSPHYKYLNGNKRPYKKYCKKKVGHTLTRFNNLIENFSMDKLAPITVLPHQGYYIIHDGFHRCCLLYKLGYKTVEANIKIPKKKNWKLKFNINEKLLL